MDIKEVRAPVALRALIQRINRHLTPRGEQIRASRSAATKRLFGRFYRVDRNEGISAIENVEAYARALSVLKSWERLVED